MDRYVFIVEGEGGYRSIGIYYSKQIYFVHSTITFKWEMGMGMGNEEREVPYNNQTLQQANLFCSYYYHHQMWSLHDNQIKQEV